MLKLTIDQIASSLHALTAIGNQPIRGNATLAYNLSKIIKGLRIEAETAREQEAKLFRLFGAHEKDQQLWFEPDQLTAEQKADFGKQQTDLHAVEIEIWGNPILVREIDAAGLSLSPIQFEQLDWLIKDESETEAQPTETAKATTA